MHSVPCSEFGRLGLVGLVAGMLSLALQNSPAEGDFEELHTLISPQSGESRWMEIDWHPTVWEGRMKAAAEGKPIFFMAGSGGAPCAGC